MFQLGSPGHHLWKRLIKNESDIQSSRTITIEGGLPWKTDINMLFSSFWWMTFIFETVVEDQSLCLTLICDVVRKGHSWPAQNTTKQSFCADQSPVTSLRLRHQKLNCSSLAKNYTRLNGHSSSLHLSSFLKI